MPEPALRRRPAAREGSELFPGVRLRRRGYSASQAALGGAHRIGRRTMAGVDRRRTRRTDRPLRQPEAGHQIVQGFGLGAQAAGRQQLCFGAPLASNAIISLQNYGTAAAKGLDFIINGTPVANAYDWATLEPALKSAGA